MRILRSAQNNISRDVILNEVKDLSGKWLGDVALMTEREKLILQKLRG
jgi:hypothetical protein